MGEIKKLVPTITKILPETIFPLHPGLQISCICKIPWTSMSVGPNRFYPDPLFKLATRIPAP